MGPFFLHNMLFRIPNNLLIINHQFLGFFSPFHNIIYIDISKIVVISSFCVVIQDLKLNNYFFMLLIEKTIDR